MRSETTQAPIAVRVHRAAKSYPVRPTLGVVRGRDVARVPVLQDVSFEVRRGQAVGIIGANGAGKSTLLRLLAGLSTPTSGRIEVEGGIGCLLDLGSGLVEDWTGAENAERLRPLLGGRPGRSRESLERVRDFAEIGEFWDAPVRTYSSGMRLRLAYAIVAGLRPEVLIVDEVLSVGDEGFQRRCMAHILDFVGAGGTMILASHNLYQVERLCDSAVWLRRGRMAAYGPPRSVTGRYRASLADAKARPGAEPSRCRLTLVDPRDRPCGSVHFSEGVGLRVEGGASRLAIHLLNLDGVPIGSFSVDGDGTLRLPPDSILPGHYTAVAEEASGGAESVLAVEVVGDRREIGAVHLPHHWVKGGE